MIAKFLILISFISSHSYAAEKLDDIIQDVEETCKTLFVKFNLEEYITPLAQDIDDRSGNQELKRKSVIMVLDQMDDFFMHIQKGSLGSSLNFPAEIIDQSFCPKPDDVDSFIFSLEKYNPHHSTLYYTSASCGNPDAIFALGHYYETDKRDAKYALMFYCYAAYKNSQHAQQRLGDAYYYGDLGLEKNLHLAKKYTSRFTLRKSNLTTSSSSFSTSFGSTIFGTGSSHGSSTPRDTPRNQIETTPRTPRGTAKKTVPSKALPIEKKSSCCTIL